MKDELLDIPDAQEALEKKKAREEQEKKEREAKYHKYADPIQKQVLRAIRNDGSVLLSPRNGFQSFERNAFDYLYTNAWEEAGYHVIWRNNSYTYFVKEYSLEIRPRGEGER